MRKLLSKVIVLAALAAVLMTATAAAAEIGTGVVEADSLRVRAEPDLDAPTVSYLLEGTQVQVHEDLGDWFQISWGDCAGYVSAEYLTYTPAVSGSSTPAAPAPSAAAAAGQTGVVTGIGVNFRSAPDTDSFVFSVIEQGEEMTVLDVSDGWCEMNWNGQLGYVNADYVSVDGIPLVDPQGIVTGDCVNIRSAPTTDAGIVTRVYAGSLVDLLSLEDGWYAVSCQGTVGYIKSDYIRVYDGSSTGSAIGSDVVEIAMQYLGTPYVYGGSSAKGFDCSGFTMYVFNQLGYSLPHSATSQWNNSGTYVERSDLQPGDLVLFCDPSRSNGKACSHVGIYIGDNEFIHASSSTGGKCVRTDSLGANYYSKYYVGAKRVG